MIPCAALKADTCSSTRLIPQSVGVFQSKNQPLYHREAAIRFGGEQTMLQAKPSLREDLRGQTAEESSSLSPSRRSNPAPHLASEAVAPQRPSPELVQATKSNSASRQEKVIAKFKPRAPVIIGEAAYTGMMAVEGGLCGQLGANGGALGVRQRTKSSFFGSGPELNGELIFKDMLRVNGHIAGHVQSHNGTLIVDSMARLDADVEVAVAVIGGTVNGDIVAHQRVEVGPEARIRGNIWTQSIAIQPGAIFEGVCRMLQSKKASE